MDINYYKKYEPIDGKWYINKKLGSGAFGTVFEIERRDFTNDKSALKIITIPASSSEVESYREENYDLDEKSVSSYFYGFVEEFIKEFQLMTKLKGNSNIVSIEDYDVKKHTDEIGWDILIRMELLTPINKYFAQNPPKTRDVIKLGIDICKALEVCQKFNIVHRDIKPSNIFVSDTGEYKLGDFGVARTLEKTSSGLSKKGTYTYMAPEVYKGEAYGSNVDIYSLGIVMYKLLNNNKEPFKFGFSHEDEENALVSRMKNTPMPAPENANGRLAEIILKACSYEPKDRYESPLQMREELESILHTENETLSHNFENISRNDEPDTMGIFSKTSENDWVCDDDSTVGIFDDSTSKINNTITDGVFDEEKDQENSKFRPKQKVIGIVCAILMMLSVSGPAFKLMNTPMISKEIDTTNIVKSPYIVDVSAYGSTTVGLKSDGTVVAVGYNEYEQCNVENWTDIVAISASGMTTVGLKSDGTVVAVGYNEDGQCNVENWTDIVDISASAYHTVGLKSDGTVVAVGHKADGKCNVENWTDIVDISVNGYQTVGLKSDGTVVAVGYNEDGQCNVENWTDIVAISAGSFTTVGLKSDGTVVAVGYNGHGQCKFENWTDIVAISASDYHTVGLKSDGTVVAVGHNKDGQCNVENWTDIVDISASDYHTVGLKSDGTVVAVGDNGYGQCNVEEW